MKKLTIITAITSLILFTACEDTITDQGVHNEDHDELQELVDDVESHFVDGPFITVTLATDKADAQNIDTAHHCYKATSTSGEGWLTYTVEVDEGETAADMILFLDASGITAELFNANDKEYHGLIADLDEVKSSSIKSAVEFHDIPAGVYHLMLEDVATNADLKLMLTHSEGHEDHEGHDHDDDHDEDHDDDHDEDHDDDHDEDHDDDHDEDHDEEN